jgi:hypothetical protein
MTAEVYHPPVDFHFAADNIRRKPVERGGNRFREEEAMRVHTLAFFVLLGCLTGCGGGGKTLEAKIETDVDGASGILGKVSGLLEEPIDDGTMHQMRKMVNATMMGDTAHWDLDVKFKGKAKKLTIYVEMIGVSAARIRFVSDLSLVNEINKTIMKFQEKRGELPL